MAKRTTQAATNTNQSEPEVDDALFPNSDDLAAAEEAWKGGIEENERGRPLGNHQVEVKSAELTRAASSNNLQIHYQLEILTPGDFQGEEIPKYDGLTGSPRRVAITQQGLMKLGIDPKRHTLKTLPAALVNVQGMKMLVNCKMNGEFYNIVFLRQLNESMDKAGATMAAGRPASRNGPGGTVGGGGGRPSGRKF